MKDFVIVSKCLKLKISPDLNKKSEAMKKNLAVFHFKGFYKGLKVTKVEALFDPVKFDIKENVEYVVYLTFLGEEKGILRGAAFRCRRLKEIC